jgi:hypothetical protein
MAGDAEGGTADEKEEDSIVIPRRELEGGGVGEPSS